MIRVERLGFAYAEQAIFTGLDFTIERGETLSIIGPNGCGKSTLLRLLRGNLRPHRGEIRWDDRPLLQLSSKERARRIAVVPQSTTPGFSYSVRALVAMGRYPYRRNLLSFETAEDRRSIGRALAVTDMLQLADRPVNQLSGGELQRVLLARALAQESPVLFLDEATSQLDIDHKLEFCELLLRLQRERGTTIVQISHDLDLAATISNRILMLTQNGQVAAIGPPEPVITADNLRRVFRVNVKVASNPFTGTPQIFPLINASGQRLDHLKLHIICGGGSGASLLRRLYLTRASVSVGPLNRGDSDETLATALNMPVSREFPFQPYSTSALQSAAEKITAADALIVATLWWGSGNLACLELAEKALLQGKKVLFLGAVSEQDYTGGKAGEIIRRLEERGALLCSHLDPLLDQLNSTA